MAGDETAVRMRREAGALLRELDSDQRELVALAFGDDAARRWIEYRPLPRPGGSLALMSVAGRKAAYRLLATGLSEHSFAQAMAIVALEEVLDLREQRAKDRHGGNYFLTVFGDPVSDDVWSWRFEGHHLSVTMTIAGDEVSPAPVFLGANPARVSWAGRPVSRPLGPEEDLGHALLDALGPAGRAEAVLADQAPGDIRTATSARAGQVGPLGVAAGALGPTARAMLEQLVALYLDRLPEAMAAREAAKLAGGELHFAWEGPPMRDGRHYYRVQADNLLIEFDKTDANHAHTVLRRPSGDFGEDILAAHYREAGDRQS
ncbi:MAG TPA: DUF3500 domain-containing protein [Streptosporangiaceae bacterium]|nr:DUF3500 domain-containing protein [Streptosporangiaceae bacterium]